jgi:hypothetical protein
MRCKKRIVVIFILALLFACDLFAQVENDKSTIYGAPGSTLNRSQIENLLKRVRRDRYHVYEDFSIDSLMIPGAIWRSYDSTGYYLKYMDLVADSTTIPDSVVWYQKIWILNHDYDSLGAGGMKVLAEIPIIITNDTLINFDTLVFETEDTLWVGGFGIIVMDTLVNVDTIINRNIIKLNYKEPLALAGDSLTVDIPTKIPILFKKDTIIAVDTLIDIITTPVLMSYWDGSEYIYFTADSIIRIDTIESIDTLITKNILRLNYKEPLYVIDDSLTVDTRIPARLPLTFGKDTLVIIDTLVKIDTVYDGNVFDFDRNGFAIIDIVSDTLITTDTLITGDTLKLNYKSPLAVVNDSLTLQLLLKAPLTVSIDTVVKIDTLISLDAIPHPTISGAALSIVDTLITIDTLLVSRDTIKLLYKEPLYMDGDTLTVKMGGIFARAPLYFKSDTSIVIDTLFNEEDNTFTIKVDTLIKADTLSLKYKLPLQLVNDSLAIIGLSDSSTVIVGMEKINDSSILVKHRTNIFDNGLLTKTARLDSFMINFENHYYSDVFYYDTNYYVFYIINTDSTIANNTGRGIGIFKEKIEDTLQFKSLVPGWNIQLLTNNFDEIEINSLSGEGRNLGGGYEIFKEKTHFVESPQETPYDIFNFKTLKEGYNITIQDSGDYLTINSNATGGGNNLCINAELPLIYIGGNSTVAYDTFYYGCGDKPLPPDLLPPGGLLIPDSLLPNINGPLFSVGGSGGNTILVSAIATRPEAGEQCAAYGQAVIQGIDENGWPHSKSVWVCISSGGDWGRIEGGGSGGDDDWLDRKSVV